MINVVLLYKELIPSVVLCAYTQLEYLNNSKEILFKHCKTADVTSQDLNWADVVFMVRSDSYYEEELAKLVKRKSKYLVYVLDDDLLNVSKDLESYCFFNTVEVRQRIKNIIYISDCIMSPSNDILENYSNNKHKKVLIEQPAIMQENSNHISANDKIKIGFAGTIDRQSDLDLFLTNVIKKVKTIYNEKVDFEFFGAKPLVCTEMGLVHYEYEENYNLYQKKMSELRWDIGLAPIADTSFNRCKHYNKYIEYGSYHIVGIYSNLAPYTKIIKDKHNGILCNNTEEEWLNAISVLIEDSILRESIKARIKKDISEHFAIEVVVEKFRKELEEISKNTAPSRHITSLTLLKTKSFVWRIFLFIKRNHIYFPIKVVKKFKHLVCRKACLNR